MKRLGSVLALIVLVPVVLAAVAVGLALLVRTNS